MIEYIIHMCEVCLIREISTIYILVEYIHTITYNMMSNQEHGEEIFIAFSKKNAGWCQ